MDLHHLKEHGLDSKQIEWIAEQCEEYAKGWHAASHSKVFIGELPIIGKSNESNRKS